MSSDSEIDDLQRFEESKQRDLAKKAGLRGNQFEEADLSDEEVMGLGNDSESEDEGQEAYYDQDDRAVESKREQTNREIEDNWGQTRDNYFGGEDDIGESDAASEEEEQEALRLRQRELEDMNASDFVDEDDLEDWKSGAAAEEEEDEKQVDNFDISSMSPQERKELIEEKFPAVLLLSKQLAQCDTWAEELKDSDKSDELKEIGNTALMTYRGMICAFFALFTDRIQKGDIQGLNSLEEHPVNEGLLMARQMWLNFNEIKDKKHDTTTDERVSTGAEPAALDNGVEPVSESEPESESGMSDDEAHDRFMNSEDDVDTSDSDEEFAIAKPSKQRSTASKKPQVVGDFDETADTIEQQARAKNKQSLRFYTSQIGKNDKRSQQPQISGDDDLPYKEREFERRQRLMAEAQRRGQQAQDRLGGDDLGDDYDDDMADEDGDDALSHYNSASVSKAAQKAMKMQRHEEALEAARKGHLDQYLAENPNIDKRAINYQIEKNKGLTRHRKKENRNARVKKRVRYDQAQKRLKGVRREYKQPTGPYQGELTGIRKNLTHSTRFKN